MKKKKVVITIILIACIALVALTSLYLYNEMRTAQGLVKERFESYKTAYGNRMEYVFDAIRSIYFQIEPEQKALQNIVSARAEWENGSKLTGLEEQLKAFKQSEELLEKGFRRVEEVATSKENIKKNKEYQNIVSKRDNILSGVTNTRNELQQAIQRYNKKISSFPATFIASFYRFQPF